MCWWSHETIASILGRHVLRTTADVMASHLGGVARSGALNVMGRLAYGNDVVIARFVEACRTRVPPKDIARTTAWRS